MLPDSTTHISSSQRCHRRQLFPMGYHIQTYRIVQVCHSCLGYTFIHWSNHWLIGANSVRQKYNVLTSQENNLDTSTCKSSAVFNPPVFLSCRLPLDEPVVVLRLLCPDLGVFVVSLVTIVLCNQLVKNRETVSAANITLVSQLALGYWLVSAWILVG